MKRATEPAAAKSDQGFVLVAALWILAALAALTVIFSTYLSNVSRGLALSDTAEQADAQMSAGLELAAYQLSLPGEPARLAQGAFRFRLANADVSVTYISEAARIDLNQAPKELIANLFVGFGADPAQAAQYAERIIGWRTPPKAGTESEETSLYNAAGLSYAPRQSPFPNVNELALVLGVPPALVDRALPFVTVFSGMRGVDPWVAPPEVLAALPGMTPAALTGFVRARAALPRDKAAIVAALGPAAAYAAIDKSENFRILMNIKFDNGRQISSEAVIQLVSGGEPYRTLSWRMR